MRVLTLGSVLVAGVLLTACASPPAARRLGFGIRWFGVDDCDDVAVHESQFLLLACHSDSNDFPAAERRKPPANRDMDAYVVKVDQQSGQGAMGRSSWGHKYDGAFRIQLDSAGWRVGGRLH